MCHRVWFTAALAGVDIYFESQTIDVTLFHIHIGPILYLGSSVFRF